MVQTLFPRFADIIRNTAQFDLSNPSASHPLLLDQTDARGRSVKMLYAPFDHVNRAAKIAIVGMTPGAYQAQQALAAARRALTEGKSMEQAAKLAKTFASFSGEPMRSNLIRMMDCVGIADALGLKTTGALWNDASELVHFTSALRYPVFIDGQNWSGTPDMVRTSKLREWLLAWTGTELQQLRDCIIVPLGPKVAAAMQFLASEKLISPNLIMEGMPHPSGANQERINCFLGDKPADQCSSKTNPAALAAARTNLERKVTLLAE